MADPSHLERENDAHIRDLSAKVDALKSVCGVYVLYGLRFRFHFRFKELFVIPRAFFPEWGVSSSPLLNS